MNITWVTSRENLLFAYVKTKAQISCTDTRDFSINIAKLKSQISCTITVQLISDSNFPTLIVKSLYYLNPKFQASSHLLWLYSSLVIIFTILPSFNLLTIKPYYEKTCLLGFQPGLTQTRLYNHRRWLES